MRKVVTKKEKREAQISTSRGISPMFRNSIPRELCRFRMRGITIMKEKRTRKRQTQVNSADFVDWLLAIDECLV